MRVRTFRKPTRGRVPVTGRRAQLWRTGQKGGPTARARADTVKPAASAWAHAWLQGHRPQVIPQVRPKLVHRGAHGLGWQDPSLGVAVWR